MGKGDSITSIIENADLMEIEKKQKLFCSGNPLAHSIIQVADALEYGIRLHKSFTANTYCETHAVCASPRINKGGLVFIGMHSYANDGGYMRDGVFIGRFCSIGRRVSIGAALHSVVGLSTSPIVKGVSCDTYTASENEYLFGIEKPTRSAITIIENDVWIGDGAVILPGIRIGSGSVIAANSVVNRDVVPYEVVGGVPIRTLRFRFPENIIENLLSTSWWNYPISYINSLPAANVLKFLDEFDPGVTGVSVAGTFKLN